MKRFIQRTLQRVLGFQSYLFAFARFKIHTLALDKNERDFFTFLHLLPDSGSVIDAGANLGVMTYYLSKKSSSLNVHAFEPVPPNLQTLQQVVDRYKLDNVTVHPFGLGKGEEIVTIIMPEENGVRMQGLSHVTEDVGGKTGETFEVQIKDLDSVLSESEKVVGIKLDVENHESEVLKGSLKLIRAHHPVIYAELWDNDNRSSCLDILKSEEYEVFQVERGKLVPWVPERSGQNFLFIWKGSGDKSE